MLDRPIYNSLRLDQQPHSTGKKKENLMNIDQNEIARLTEEYGGQWGINHTRRLLQLISIISEGQQYNSDAV